MEKQRIDKFLSNQLLLSRNEIRTGIKKGYAAVNGNISKDFSQIIDPRKDEITYCGKKVDYKKYVYIMLNKPAGVLSASSDKNRKTVLDLVPGSLRRKGLSVVGRLDKDTTGLLLMTDDGGFAHKCISPKSKIEKSYIVELDCDINADIIGLFKKGVVLADGYKCRPAVLQKLENRIVRVIITEGKYHQIKRMFGAVSIGVNRLHRERIGSLCLPENLASGECVEVEQEVLKQFF
ncbi:MAG: rRNA pseudouridine synthase [Clostridia bacterium]|nr:rRNA pseudouridine synthase [Clostridia bacterium]